VKAILRPRYGSPDDLEFRDIEVPSMDADGVLVRVRASSVNAYDWHLMRGLPYLVRTSAGLRRPASPGLGVDLAGQVEAVGSKVTRFQPGDEVFGARGGAFAEYVSTSESRVLLPKPASLTFAQAAAVPLAGTTALQSLRDAGRIEAGQKVLVNGAAGGVGTFAVQIAKAFGAEVTGVCSTPNVETVRSIGADHVVDYAVDDFTRHKRRYDLVLDVVGNRTLADLRRALTPKGTLVLVGGGHGKWLGPLALPLRALAISRFVRQRLITVLANFTRPDLATLAELIEAGKVSPFIGRTYPLSETPEAIRHVEAGHARGKTVIDI